MFGMRQIKTQRHTRSMRSVRHQTGPCALGNWLRLKETEQLHSMHAGLRWQRTGQRMRLAVPLVRCRCQRFRAGCEPR